MARPAGAISKRTQAQIAKAGSTGEMPLDALLKAMRYHLKRFDEAIKAQDEDKAKEALAAAGIFAKDAAPYVHARLANVQVQSETTIHYVARIPEAKPDALSWHEKHVPEQHKGH